VPQTYRATSWPIGIRLFNRPHYAARLLESLRYQTMDLAGVPIFVRIDGYQGSFDQLIGRPDRTQEVFDQVKRYFPDAVIHRYETNQGIAEVNFALQIDTYKAGAHWAIYFEEDIVLHKTFVQAIHHMIDISNDIEDVVKVAIGQLNLSYINVPPQRTRSQFYLSQGTKAFAERRSFFFERKHLTQYYLKTISERQYSDRDERAVFASLAEVGIFTIMGNNDVVHDRITTSCKRLHVTSPESLVQDVGVEGETDFIHPDIHVPDQLIADVFTTTSEDLRRALPDLHAEARAFEQKFFEDFWDGYMASKSGRLALNVLMGKVLRTLKH
jgi:hypothetical protein